MEDKGTILTSSEGSFPGGLRCLPSPLWALFSHNNNASNVCRLIQVLRPKYCPSSYCAPGCVLSTGDTAVTQADGPRPPALTDDHVTKQIPAPGV